MSRLGPNQMTVKKVESLKDGTHSDGGNLWLTVQGKARTWSIRYTSPTTGRRREMGIGPYRDVGLAAARELAGQARQLLRKGVDPLDHRRAEQGGRRDKPAHTFQAVAERYIVDQTPGWRDTRLPGIWSSSLQRLAYSRIGDKAVEAVDTEDVIAILRPIWETRTETADRVRGRMERILDYARTQGWREGDNPARWKGHLSHILPRPSTVSQVQHRAALPYPAIGPVMDKLASSTGVGALAVRFACLTAARSNEVRGATWSEVDLVGQVWTIPAERMKAKRGHRVPLSAPALAILAGLQPLAAGKAGLVFPGGRVGRPLSDVALSSALHLAAGTKGVTVHGLRSTFRDWAAEATDYPREVAEMALAHVIADKVEAAYRRGDLFDKRRAMMEAWADFTMDRKDGGAHEP
ncbi:MAG: tyrosine-type recombinase/integrase [Janthinobacterium lividum]